MLASALALTPDGDDLSANPGPAARSLAVDGLRYRRDSGSIRTSEAGEVIGSSGPPLVVG